MIRHPELLGHHTAMIGSKSHVLRLAKNVALLVGELEHSGSRITVVTCGLATNMLAGVIQATTGCRVAVARKASEMPVMHGSPNILHNEPIERWIFLDDTIATGGTLRHVESVIGWRPIAFAQPDFGVERNEPVRKDWDYTYRSVFNEAGQRAETHTLIDCYLL